MASITTSTLSNGLPLHRVELDGTRSVTILVAYVLPRFEDFFKSFKAKLPLPTRMLISFGNFMQNWWWLILGVIVLSLFLINNLRNSRLGRAWMAIREDEVAAAATGINTVTTKLLAFALGASFSGFAGTYYASKLFIVSPESFSFQSVSVVVLVMVVLGGMGSMRGVIVGALLIYFIQSYVLIQLPGWIVSATTAVNHSMSRIVNRNMANPSKTR